MEVELIIALIMLIGMEIVLGVDNLVFIAILSNKLPIHQRSRARKIGLSLAVGMRLAMLAGASWLVSLTRDWFTIAGLGISGKDMIFLLGGLFLIAKATLEIHHRVDPTGEVHGPAPAKESASTADVAGRAGTTFAGVVFQILLIDAVFSVDSIVVAVGMVDEHWMIVIAILVSIGVMMVAADPLSDFIERNPTVVMLAHAFLVMIGMVLVAEGVDVHIPKGFVYVAMAFSAAVEGLNILARSRAAKAHASHAAEPAPQPPSA